MKSGLMDKLSSYAALIGVIGAIGGGFYTWGEFNNRLSAIEGNNIDVSGIEINSKNIAVIDEKIGKLDISGIAVLEEKVKKIEDRPASKDWSKDIEVLRKELEYIKLEIEELKLKAKNPLAN